jgi:hypothetical protein
VRAALFSVPPSTDAIQHDGSVTSGRIGCGDLDNLDDDAY